MWSRCASPSVPVLAAVSVMEAENDPYVPVSMTLMGGPIDTRRNPTAVNNLAAEKGIDWFRNNVITKVPFPHPGVMRDVYPGFLQLNGFISMNLDRHMDAHKKLFQNLVKGDGDLVDKHRDFYDEYLAVMDLTAEYYLQTVDTVFVKHALPKGEMTHRGKPVDPSKIVNVALMTVEGENDDISGLGQTEATHCLCSSIPDDRRVHYVQKGVGHYGVFNGSRFKSEIVPRISDFMSTCSERATARCCCGVVRSLHAIDATHRDDAMSADRIIDASHRRTRRLRRGFAKPLKTGKETGFSAYLKKWCAIHY